MSGHTLSGAYDCTASSFWSIFGVLIQISADRRLCTFLLSKLAGGLQSRKVDRLKNLLVQLSGFRAVKCHTQQDERVGHALLNHKLHQLAPLWTCKSGRDHAQQELMLSTHDQQWAASGQNFHQHRAGDTRVCSPGHVDRHTLGVWHPELITQGSSCHLFPTMAEQKQPAMMQLSGPGRQW